MRILIPVDGSFYSKAAVRFIASRIPLLGQKPQIEFLNVQPVPEHMIPQLKMKNAKAEQGKAQAEALFAALRDILIVKGVEPETKIRTGFPAADIADEAEKYNADLIIMGCRGLTNFEKLFMGSVTTGVLSRTKIPVLIIRDNPAPEHEGFRIGLAVDDSPYSLAAARHLAAHKNMLEDAEITLIHAVELPERPWPGQYADIPAEAMMSAEDIERDQKAFDRMAAEEANAAFDRVTGAVKPILDEAGFTVRTARLTGNPGAEIARYAESEKLDLVVMGTRGRDNFRSVVLGSVTSRVAADGYIPLLVVPEPA